MAQSLGALAALLEDQCVQAQRPEAPDSLRSTSVRCGGSVLKSQLLLRGRSESNKGRIE